MDQEKIGKFICENRKKKGITQEELAKKLKVSNYTISNWENGKSMPSYELLIILTKELDISVSELINGRYEDNKDESNKNIEKVIKFLRKIDENKKIKNRNIGIIIIIVGILIKILSMIFIPYYIEYDSYYVILSYIVILFGASVIFYEENVKSKIIKTLGIGFVALLFFIGIDVGEIKLIDTNKESYNSPRYCDYWLVNNNLSYCITPFYDVYACVKYFYMEDDVRVEIVKGYEIAPKRFNIDVKILGKLEQEYCKEYITKNNSI